MSLHGARARLLMTPRRSLYRKATLTEDAVLQLAVRQAPKAPKVKTKKPPKRKPKK